MCLFNWQEHFLTGSEQNRVRSADWLVVTSDQLSWF